MRSHRRRGSTGERTELERREQHDQHERRREEREQPKRSGCHHAHACDIQQRAHDHHCQTDHHPTMSHGEPRHQSRQVRDKQRGINRHVEDARHQRQPRLLKSPQVPHRATNPCVVATLGGNCRRELADHERRRQTPDHRRQQQNEDSAQIAGTMHDVLSAIGATRNHEKRCGDQGPQSQLSGFSTGCGRREYFGTSGVSGGRQFLWLPPWLF